MTHIVIPTKYVVRAGGRIVAESATLGQASRALSQAVYAWRRGHLLPDFQTLAPSSYTAVRWTRAERPNNCGRLGFCYELRFRKNGHVQSFGYVQDEKPDGN